MIDIDPVLCVFCQTEIYAPRSRKTWVYACSKTCFDLYLDTALLTDYRIKEHQGVRIHPKSLTKRCTVYGVQFQQEKGWYEISDPHLLNKLGSVKDGRVGYMFEIRLNTTHTVGLYKGTEELTLCLQEPVCA
jgi:hypothetical protein